MAVYGYAQFRLLHCKMKPKASEAEDSNYDINEYISEVKFSFSS